MGLFGGAGRPRGQGACPRDLTHLRPRLQRPDTPAIDPNTEVTVFIRAEGGARTAKEQLAARMQLYRTALAQEKAARDPFDPAARQAADERISGLEDSLLLGDALMKAIDCRQ
ncbi:MAG: hypothetical protein HXY25_11655 [Alphaproteobacteria bacterium]|nr:hypothetical protein [Alphaproteobacteria bacterium]